MATESNKVSPACSAVDLTDGTDVHDIDCQTCQTKLDTHDSMEDLAYACSGMNGEEMHAMGGIDDVHYCGLYDKRETPVNKQMTDNEDGKSAECLTDFDMLACSMEQFLHNEGCLDSVDSLDMASVTAPPILFTPLSISQNASEGARAANESTVDISRTEENEHLNNAEAAAAGGVPVDSTIDQLLQRHRNEIMFELRRLTLGDRPVTGQTDRRQAVERLVSRAVHVDSAPRTNRPPAPRPEQVLVEVNALVERRPVSSILQSAAFRRSLENSLRGALGSLRGASVGSLPATNLQRRHDNTTAVTMATVDERSTHSASVVDVSSNGSELSGSASSLPRSSVPRPPPLPHDEPVQPPTPQPPVVGPARAQAWLQQHVRLISVEEQQQMTAAEMLEQAQRDSLISDISDLIQRQLVTSSLHGEFRQVLERRMRHHLAESGVDGRRVQQFVQLLPRSHGHQRNDFLDLGIIPPAMQAEAMQGDVVDDVSVISATAAVTLPHAYTQSTAMMTRDITSLKAQMLELKSLMQLSFDLQLDIQRAIRQEVAAAMAQTHDQSAFDITGAVGVATGGAVGVATGGAVGLATGGVVGVATGGAVGVATGGAVGGATGGVVGVATGGALGVATGGAVGVATGGAAGGGAVNDGQCLICLDKPVDTVLYQCGHMCLCHPCGMQLRHRGAHCPVCRAPIRDIIRAYRSA